MSTVRLFSPTPLRPDYRFELDSRQSRYLSRALRLRVGDSLVLFDGAGGEYASTLVCIGKNQVEIETGEFRNDSVESPLAIHLVQGISKGDRMDVVVQKAAELGVAHITPVLTEHSVVRFDSERATSRREHWQKIAQSACEQCGRNLVPEIDGVMSLLDWHSAQSRDDSRRLILQPGARQTITSSSSPEGKVALLVGPEGGFSELEYERASEGGFDAISLGPRVLRTETAAIAAVVVVQALWGDLTMRP